MFKKGDLVLYKYPNHELRGVIGIVIKDSPRPESARDRTKVHFANVVKYKTRYLLNNSLIRAPK